MEKFPKPTPVEIGKFLRALDKAEGGVEREDRENDDEGDDKVENDTSSKN
jgi:hypothetical protein